MSTPLTGSASPVALDGGDYSLMAPGLVGDVTLLTAPQNATRGAAAGQREAEWLQAVDRAGLFAGPVLDIQVQQDLTPPAASGTRADGLTATTRSNEPAILFSMPELQPGTDYAILYTDEGGASRWILPDHREPRPGGPPLVVFHLPRTSAPVAAAAAQTRGPLSVLGRRLVRVIAWETSGLIGKGAVALAEQWEAQNRPYGFHLIRPELFAPPQLQLAPIDWPLISSGRALLLVHGTFSSAQATFDMARATWDQLAARYGGRIFAFNHPSMSVDPKANVQQFLDRLPAGTALEVDLITHSRGGLVGRLLAERGNELAVPGKSIRVRRAVLVASPNRGTRLLDAQNDVDAIDRFTNLIATLPDTAFTLTLDAILALVKILGYGAVAGLPGLRCSAPGSEVTQWLNLSPAPPSIYYAIGGDYTPESPALLERFKAKTVDGVVDQVLGEPNDGAVPLKGTYAIGRRQAGFPVASQRRRVYNTHHCRYFDHPAVQAQIVQWLQQP